MFRKVYPHLIALLFVTISYNSVGQQFNNWYFPPYLGITFNTSPISILLGGKIGFGNNSASISDEKGNLLFYTNGETVWNKHHLPMGNGVGLYGENTFTNSVLILPLQNKKNQYYIFTTHGFYSSGTKGYNFSIVDMDLDGGNGDVTLKNQLLYSPSLVEKIALVKHKNGLDNWLVTKNSDQKFLVFKITCAGVENTPRVSQIGIDVSQQQGSSLKAGDIKASSDGNYIAISTPGVRSEPNSFFFNYLNSIIRPGY